jgi:hypothetical protein
VPVELGRGIMKAMAKDPQSRWPSAHAMREALATVLV